MKVILIILDSVGIGAAPDAADYGDTGAHTLGNLARALTGGLRMPVLQAMGLGNIPALLPDNTPLSGIPATDTPRADYGAMRELSIGKDTTTGHWEIAGLHLTEAFNVLPPGPPSMPTALAQAIIKRTGRDIIGNKAASGTDIIEELGAEQMRTGSWIIYTSVDSVLQIAAHEDVIPLSELYQACEIARELCDPLRIGRVIARPYVGMPGAFRRTLQRRDFSYPPPAPFIMEHLTAHNIPVYAVGKLDDIYLNRGIKKSFHTGNNHDSQAKVMQLTKAKSSGLIMANFIDFDMVYGHRRDTQGYAKALEQTDTFFGNLIPQLKPDDRLIITADHGNDPTFTGTDHTREYVPLLIYQHNLTGRALGVRQGFFDIAQTLADWFNLPPWPRGKSCAIYNHTTNVKT